MVTINVLAFGEGYEQLFKFIATFMSGGVFLSLFKISTLLSIIISTVAYVKGRNPLEYAKWFFAYSVVSTLVLMPKTTVALYELTTGKTRQIANVPHVVAAVAGGVTNIGLGLAEEYESLLTNPDSLTYSKTGMLFGARLMEESHQFRIINDDLREDFNRFFKQCVVGDMRINHKYTPSTLKQSKNIFSLFESGPSPVRRVRFINSDRKGFSCQEAINDKTLGLKKRLDDEVQSVYKYFGPKIFGTTNADKYSDLFETHLKEAGDYYEKVTDSSANYVLQNMMINAIREGITQYSATTDSTAGVLNNQFSKTQTQHRAAWNIGFQKAVWFLPLLHSVLLMLCLAVIPIMLAMLILPGGTRIVKSYVLFLASFQLWPPLFAVLNAVINLWGAHKIGQYGEITSLNIDSLDQAHQDLAGVAGFLMMSIPFLARGFVSNIGEGFNSLATSMMSHMQGASLSAASEVANASYSLGNSSVHNMSMNNMSANKHDTNSLEAHGRSIMQLENGSQRILNSDGTTTTNAMPGISSIATNIHASERIAQSVVNSAHENQTQAMTHRVMADKQIQSAINNLSNFSETDNDSVRKGAVLSNSTEDSYSKDARDMVNAVDAYNRAHNWGYGGSAEISASMKFDSNKHLIGKAVAWVSGGSAESSATIRANLHGDRSLQTFLNSDQGKQFANAYHHMERTAKTENLDQSNGHDLSGSKQIAFNISKGKSLLNQASVELNKSNQLSDAASRIKESSSVLDSNYNQAFHNYVENNYPETGLSILSGTDTQSIEKQRELANEFMSSSIGKSMIENDVSRIINDVSHDNFFKEQSVKMESKYNSELAESNKHATEMISKRAQDKGLNKLENGEIEVAHSLSDGNTLSNSIKIQNKSKSGMEKVKKSAKSKFKSNKGAIVP